MIACSEPAYSEGERQPVGAYNENLNYGAVPEEPLRFIRSCIEQRSIRWTYHATMRLRSRPIPHEAIFQRGSKLIPPYVATDLMDGASDPRAMPLDRYIAEARDTIKTEPRPAEICVERVQPPRTAAESGRYDYIFRMLNGAVSAPRT